MLSLDFSFPVGCPSYLGATSQCLLFYLEHSLFHSSRRNFHPKQFVTDLFFFLCSISNVQCGGLKVKGQCKVTIGNMLFSTGVDMLKTKCGDMHRATLILRKKPVRIFVCDPARRQVTHSVPDKQSWNGNGK